MPLNRCFDDHDDHDDDSPGLPGTNSCVSTDVEEFLTTFFENQQNQLQLRLPMAEEGRLPQSPRIPHPRPGSKTQVQGDIAPFTVMEVRKGIQKLSPGKATGPDNRPNEFLKALPANALEMLTNGFNHVLRSKILPSQWKEANVQLIHKGKNEPKEKLDSYRPIALQSNIYKLFASLLSDRLQKECDSKLSDTQNGFRKHRRSSDKLFVLTQLIEMTQGANRELFLGFLDLEKAYDAVPHALLLSKMRAMKIPDDITTLIETIYNDCTSNFIFGGLTSRKVKQRVGLRQGCPLSPTLFNIFINDLLATLEDSRHVHSQCAKGKTETTCVTTLAFADAILLATSNAEDMQDLLFHYWIL